MRFFLALFFLLASFATSIASNNDYLSLRFKSLEGRDITISQLKGKPVLIEFWASWCFACKLSFKTTNKIFNKYKKKVHVIGINTDLGDPEELKEAIAENQIKFPVWLNHPDENNYFNGISSLPTFIILDNKGKIVKKITGIKKDTENELDAILSKLVN
jgi:thiol-disulfide isomerase/thioredoxin